MLRKSWLKSNDVIRFDLGFLRMDSKGLGIVCRSGLMNDREFIDDEIIVSEVLGRIEIIKIILELFSLLYKRFIVH